jgi:hypothetical protein
MDVDEEGADDDVSEESEDDGSDTDEIKALKVRFSSLTFHVQLMMCILGTETIFALTPIHPAWPDVVLAPIASTQAPCAL